MPISLLWLRAAPEAAAVIAAATVDLGVDPILIAIGSALSTAVGILWKLHLDGDGRERADAASWKAMALGNATDLGTLVALVKGLADDLKSEHTLAQSEREATARFREEVRAAVGRIEGRLARGGR